MAQSNLSMKRMQVGRECLYTWIRCKSNNSTSSLATVAGAPVAKESKVMRLEHILVAKSAPEK